MIAARILVPRVQRGWASGSIGKHLGGRKLILPAIELQPGVQAAGKQGTQAAAVNEDDTFSAAFGASLRETAQGQSVQTEAEVDAKTAGKAEGRVVSGESGRGVSSGLAAEISGRVAEAVSQAAKQSVNQAAAGTAVAAKTPVESLKMTAAEVAKASAGATTEAIEKGPFLTDSQAIAAGTAGAKVRVDNEVRSNLVKASNGDENEELVAAGSEVAKSSGAAAGVAAAGGRASGLVNAASTVSAGKAKAVTGAVDQTPESEVAASSALSQAIAAGVPSGKVVADPAAIVAGTVKAKVATLFALDGEPKSTAVKASAGFGSSTAAAGLKDRDALASAGTAQAGKVATGPGDVESVEQAQTLALAANTQVRSAVSAAAGSNGTLTGAVQTKVPVTARAASTTVPETLVAKVQATKVQGGKSGVSGAGAAVTGGKGTALETSVLQASAAEVAANAAAGALSQRGTGAPAVQTAALEVPAALPATSATTDAATIAASLASSLASRFAILGVPLAQAEQAQGDASAIRQVADAKTGSKAGTASGLETDAKSGVAKPAGAGSSNAVATTSVAVHASLTQAGAASVQAIAAARVLPAQAPATSVASSKSSVHSVQSVGTSPQAAAGRAVAEANVPAPVVATEDKAPVASGAAGTAERPAVEGARTADSSQQAPGVAAGQAAGQGAGQGVSRPGVSSAANQVSTSTAAADANSPAGTATSTSAGAPFAEVAATAGLHAAGAPAVSVSAPNGTVAAVTGVIAAGHPAAVAGVAAGAGGTGTTAAGVVSSALSAAGGAARSDLATAAEPHRTLVATPTTLEVGVPDGTQGWLRIRAEVGDQGQVNASLAAGSGASQEMLHRDLPALNAYLHSEQMAVTATVSDRSFLAAGGGQTGLSNDLGRALAGDTGGALPQGGASGSQQDNARQESVPGSSAMNPTPGYSGTAGLSDATIANSTGFGYDGESGRWLNVRA